MQKIVVAFLKRRLPAAYKVLQWIKYLLIDLHERILRVFARYMVMHIVPMHRNSFITADWNERVGTGCQSLGIYSAFLYSHMHKLPYLHSPLKVVDHNYNQDQKFEQKIENFLQFSKGEKLINEVNLPVVHLDNIGEIISFLFRSKILNNGHPIIFHKRHYHEWADAHADKYLEIQNKLREKFIAGSVNYRKHQVTEGKINVVVHIRRGDVDASNAYRYTSNSFIREQMENLQTSLLQTGSLAEFHIYSQGIPADFSDLDDLAQLHLNGNIFDDFYNLVHADILIVARSSFSYSAAILSKGIIICDPYIHNSPLSHWIVYRNKTDLLSDNALRKFNKLSAKSSKIRHLIPQQNSDRRLVQRD
ncbi:MAG: hypothetical protein HKN76_10885 [Saprospiraceae bacterium]|nr:hypothetical protein [Saprospiraceae bacterium]